MPLSPIHSIAAVLMSIGSMAVLSAAEIRIIQPGHEPSISGKEVDWIYGDYLLQNDQISAVVAAPLASRDANMTTRKIGGSILDLTLNEPSNDQLTAYIPAAGRYLFEDPERVEYGRDGESVYWQCRSTKSLANEGTTATVRYQLSDGNAFVESMIIIEGDQAETVRAFDGVRADGDFAFSKTDRTAYCTDPFFRQTIGFQVPGSDGVASWKRDRPHKLLYDDRHVERVDGSLTWNVHLYPATSLIDLISVAENSGRSPSMRSFRLSQPLGPFGQGESVDRAELTLRSVGEDGEVTDESHTLQTNDQGVAHARLVPGKYVAVAEAIGYDAEEFVFRVEEKAGEVILPLKNASGFSADVTDEVGNRIPVKATIYSSDGEHPDFGPSSTRTFVQNCVYSVHGRFRCPLDPGTYEVLFSRGPEYSMVSKRIEVLPKRMSDVRVRLERVVDTAGWVSAELHSHSSPSGDNTSDQYGRVENLLCEHLEFAPCTEHNRISSYSPHLKKMNLSHLMATCTGIELTGTPLPVNHQNSFPLHRHPHTQNGGGPRPASNPIAQIERLALWDSESQKLVQMNHPNLHQIHGDLDVDGVPDRGFRGMFAWTDVIEVHPLQTIFEDVADDPPNVRRMRIPLFQWMQLLNQGYRIPAVINTDAHYNHHGSGWRRNWFASSTDDPADISADEMVRQAEAGHVVMSTGPFLSVAADSDSSERPAIPGDDLRSDSGHVTLKVSVQCPNWLDVNRVQLFINGRPSPQHNYTRKVSPERFTTANDVRKFDSSIDVNLSHDAHLIVATIGEGMTMQKVMGKRYGTQPPIAVSNPIFVDVDGSGFQSNGDELGLPLPGSEPLR